MKTILETDRLLLREFVMADVEDFFRIVSDPDVTRYTGEGGNTLEEARKWLEERLFQDYRKYSYGRWAAVYKPTGRVVGSAGLKYLDDVNEVDLGYRFFKEHWGKGLATEASRAVLAYGFGMLCGFGGSSALPTSRTKPPSGFWRRWASRSRNSRPTGIMR